MQSVLFWGKEVSNFLAGYERVKLNYIFLVGVAFMDSVERCFAAVTAIGFFVTVVGMILLQTI
ncbi:hypothetical protein XH88_23315 [Bradyrhizobium sp. CCBAU 51627]|nr:hypothetical protein [Bradyrhizobium sp. CCBAU 51627]